MKTIPTSSRFSRHSWFAVVALAAAVSLPAGAQTANLALGKPADQSSRSPWSKGATTADDARGAVDGIKNGSYGFHTDNQANPWWQVDLQSISTLSEIRIFNRLDEAGRAGNIQVLLTTDGTNWQRVYTHNGNAFGGWRGGANDDPLIVSLTGLQARWVRLQLGNTTYFHLDEVEVYGTSGGGGTGSGGGGGSFAGYWNTQFQLGPVQVEGMQVWLRQSGQRVWGGYANLFGIELGALDGQIVRPGVLEGTWTEPFGSGLFRFTLNGNGRFAGDWWNSDRSYGGYWNGQFAGPLQ